MYIKRFGLFFEIHHISELCVRRLNALPSFVLLLVKRAVARVNTTADRRILKRISKYKKVYTFNQALLRLLSLKDKN